MKQQKIPLTKSRVAFLMTIPFFKNQELRMFVKISTDCVIVILKKKAAWSEPIAILITVTVLCEFLIAYKIIIVNHISIHKFST
jgi:hypothetical protein